MKRFHLAEILQNQFHNFLNTYYFFFTFIRLSNQCISILSFSYVLKSLKVMQRQKEQELSHFCTSDFAC